MTAVLLIRHAESVANTKRRLVSGRSSDTPLSDAGIQQAKNLGTFLYTQHQPPTRIVTSPAKRAVETARLSLATMSPAPLMTIEEDMHEMSQGIYENQPRELVYTEAIKKQIDALGKDFSLPDENAESMNDVARRVDHCLKRMIAQSQPEDVIYVYTHGIAICCYIGMVLNLTQQQVFERTRSLQNASVTALRFHTPGEAPEIISFGQVA